MRLGIQKKKVSDTSHLVQELNVDIVRVMLHITFYHVYSGHSYKVIMFTNLFCVKCCHKTKAIKENKIAYCVE